MIIGFRKAIQMIQSPLGENIYCEVDENYKNNWKEQMNSMTLLLFKINYHIQTIFIQFIEIVQVDY